MAQLKPEGQADAFVTQSEALDTGHRNFSIRTLNPCSSYSVRGHILHTYTHIKQETLHISVKVFR